MWDWTRGCEPNLALGVVGDEVRSGSNGDLPDRPGGVIGQVDREDTDPQLTLPSIKRERVSEQKRLPEICEFSISSCPLVPFHMVVKG